MKSKKIKNLVKKARAELSWSIRDVKQVFGPYRVYSDPKAKTHTILQTPDKQASDAGLELVFLHELGHALLCEQVHPIFATNFPVVGLDDEGLAEVAPALNAASDWFVGHWLMEYCPELAVADLTEEYDSTVAILEKGDSPTKEEFCVSALIVAQAIKYLKEPVDCGGILGEAVEAFRKAPPEKPSVLNYEELANRLLALYSSLRCRVENDNGIESLAFSR